MSERENLKNVTRAKNERATTQREREDLVCAIVRNDKSNLERCLLSDRDFEKTMKNIHKVVIAVLSVV